MNQLDQVLYTAKTHTSGGREGASRSADGRLEVKLCVPGIERDVAQRLVEAAEQVCAYSRATRGNIDVAINLV